MPITESFANALRGLADRVAPLAAGVPPIAKWPPQDGDKERFAEYAKFYDLFRGEHAARLDSATLAKDCPLYVVANLPKIIVTIPADLMLGEPFSLEFEDDASEADRAAIDEIVKRSDLQTNSYESAIDTGYSGDGLRVVERDENDQATIRAIRPDVWSPLADPDDSRKILEHRLGWVKAVGRDKFLRLVVHGRGFVRHELWKFKGSNELDRPATNAEWLAIYPAQPPEIVETGLDDFLLVHTPNFRTSRNYFGWSDYQGVETLFSALNSRNSQSNSILHRHADPNVAVPDAMFNWLKGETARSSSSVGTGFGAFNVVDPALLRVIKMGPNGEKPEYVTWDGHIADNVEYMKLLTDTIFQVCEIDRQLVGNVEAGNISGRALRVMLIRTLAKVNRKWRYESASIERCLRLAAELEGFEVDVQVQKSDGLPGDTLEDTEAAVMRVQARLNSRQREIAALNDVDVDAAKEIMAEIDGEDDGARNDAGVQNAVQGGRPNRQPIQVVMPQTGRTGE